MVKLPIGPVSAVSSVKYTDVEGNVRTLAASSYVTDLVSLPARIKLKDGYAWPSDDLKEVNGVDIEFTAGYGAAAAVPEEVRLAVNMLASYWYENRDATAGAVGNTDIKQLPLTLQDILSQIDMYQRGD